MRLQSSSIAGIVAKELVALSGSLTIRVKINEMLMIKMNAEYLTNAFHLERKCTDE